jgi:hypothetical protein
MDQQNLPISMAPKFAVFGKIISWDKLMIKIDKKEETKINTINNLNDMLNNFSNS